MPLRYSAARFGFLALGTFVVILGRTALAEEGTPEAPAGPAPTHVLSLNEAERAAITSQPQLLVARAATATALAQADQARAPLLPQVTATAEYARQGGIKAYAYESGKVLANTTATTSSGGSGNGSGNVPSNSSAAN